MIAGRVMRAIPVNRVCVERIYYGIACGWSSMRNNRGHRPCMSCCSVCAKWLTSGAKAVPKVQRDELVLEYFELLRQGYVAHHSGLPPSTAPPRQTSSLPKKPGPAKQSEAKNLLDALLKRAEQVLAFLDNLTLPFTNNLAERDLRMIKVQQKISGTFRSEKGATAFCAIRSYLATMRKQGRSMLAAMAAVFEGSPFPLAWEPGT